MKTTTKQLESQITTRRERIAELSTRRDERARDLGTAKEGISQAIAAGKEDTLDALRKNSRACAAEVDELSSAIALLDRECKALLEEARPAMIRETRAEAERTEREARAAIADLTSRIEAFRGTVIGPLVPKMWEKINAANAAYFTLTRLEGEPSGWPHVQVESWLGMVIKSVTEFTTLAALT